MLWTTNIFVKETIETIYNLNMCVQSCSTQLRECRWNEQLLTALKSTCSLYIKYCPLTLQCKMEEKYGLLLKGKEVNYFQAVLCLAVVYSILCFFLGVPLLLSLRGHTAVVFILHCIHLQPGFWWLVTSPQM
jgi:hypothetical protein